MISDSNTHKVYLVHFSRKLHHAGHYVGYTDNLIRRIAEHRTGKGARLLAACNDKNIDWRIARTWTFPNAISARTWERHIKRQHNTPRWCPVCNGRNPVEL